MARRKADPGKRETAVERHIRAFELRKQGFGYRDIGAALGVSGKTAHEDVQKVLAELSALRLASAAEYRTLELERLDSYALALHQHLDSGDPQIINSLVKISESRRKLLGLDAQSPIIVEQHHVLSESDRIGRLIELLDTARTRRSGQAVIDVTPEPGNVAE